VVSGPYRVLIVSSAAQAILEAAEWWVTNRPKAPDALAVELERALQLLVSQPYHLYYRVIAEPPTVEVLALWHTKRGTSPDLS